MNNDKLFNILTGRTPSRGLATTEDYCLDEQAIAEFSRLKNHALLQNINISICSSFRDFYRQEKIWNEKASGKRKLYDKEGQLLNYQDLSQKEILDSILTWSAIPGASRHHWGSDFDIYDANIKSQESVSLTIDECLHDFSKMYDWLDVNLNKYNFFRPYIKDQGGVSVEPWHLSFRPLACEYDLSYTFDIFLKNIELSRFLLKDLIIEDAEYIFSTFVKNIMK